MSIDEEEFLIADLITSFFKLEVFLHPQLPLYGIRACPQPGQAGTKKGLACPGNYKLQIPNYKQIPNPKSQITKQKKLRKKNVCKHSILNSLQTCQKISCQKMAKLCD
jgi:hypothetical protein